LRNCETMSNNYIQVYYSRSDYAHLSIIEILTCEKSKKRAQHVVLGVVLVRIYFNRAIGGSSSDRTMTAKTNAQTPLITILNPLRPSREFPMLFMPKIDHHLTLTHQSCRRRKKSSLRGGPSSKQVLPGKQESYVGTSSRRHIAPSCLEMGHLSTVGSACTRQKRFLSTCCGIRCL